MRFLVGVSRGTWLILGLLLRIGMLAWGVYQDKHSALAYTDIDFHVFSSAAQYLYDGCPLDKIITHHGPKEDYIDLADPPEARGKCASGVLPAVARLMLQTEASMDELETFPKVAGGPTVVQTKDDKLSIDFADRGKEQQESEPEPSKGRSVDPSPLDPSYIFFAKVVPGVFNTFRPGFRLMAGIGNPYARDTYRYTPLLALVLTPAQVLAKAAKKMPNTFTAPLMFASENYGKMLFVIADILIALLMWDIMDVRAKGKRRQDSRQNFGWLVGLLWLVNPFPAQISTRGSSESLLGVLVLGFLDVTLRGYPEESLPPLCNVQSVATNGDATTVAADAKERNGEEHVADPDVFSNVHTMAPFMFALAIHWKLYPIIYAASLTAHLGAQASQRGLRTVIHFGGLSIYSLVLITGGVVAVWGWPFLAETVVYHLRRSDHRHNFSPYFLAAHLGDFIESKSALSDNDLLSNVASILKANQTLLTFVPQLLLTAYIGFAFGGYDLVAGITFQTMAFVAFNKVSTSQYFMWFLWFLPIIAPYMSFGTSSSSRAGTLSVLTLLAFWVAAQGSWLQSAYLLEFKGLDTYVQTWLNSLLVLGVHSALIVLLVRAWARGRTKLIEAADAEERAEKAASAKAQ